VKILMLTQFYPPVIGGEERHVLNLSAELARRGHDVHVATLATPAAGHHEDRAGVTVHRVSGWAPHFKAAFADPAVPFSPPFPDPGVTAALRKLAARVRPDVVHAHNWVVNSYLPLRLCGGPPLVLTLHDYSFRCATKRYMRDGRLPCPGPGARSCLRCATAHYGPSVGSLLASSNALMAPPRQYLLDAVISVSQAVASRNRAHLPGARREVVIPNFIPAVADLRSRADDADLPAGFPEVAPILYVGDISRDKGVPVLLRAYDKLTDDRPPLVVMGKVPIKPEVETGPRAIVFHDVRHPGVLSAMARARAVVVPSTWPDPCPTVVLEAMASSRPVVASATGGILDMVRDRDTGLLVTPGDEERLARALQQVLDDPGAADAMGARAMAALGPFEVTAVAGRIEELYESLLATRGR
jgi:glycosyltransferase involved in cell wall biosynthesis